jgi:hypothetical protein
LTQCVYTFAENLKDYKIKIMTTERLKRHYGNLARVERDDKRSLIVQTGKGIILLLSGVYFLGFSYLIENLSFKYGN